MYFKVFSTHLNRILWTTQMWLCFNWRVSSHKRLANYSAEGLVTESHTHLTLSSWFILHSKYNHNAALIFAVERPEPKICSPKVQVRHHYQYQYFLNVEQCVSIRHGDFKTAPMQICRFDREETTLTQGYVLKILRIFRLHQKVLQKMVWGFKFLNSICWLSSKVISCRSQISVLGTLVLGKGGLLPSGRARLPSCTGEN